VSKHPIVKMPALAFLALIVATLAHLFYAHQALTMEDKDVVLASYQH